MATAKERKFARAEKVAKETREWLNTISKIQMGDAVQFIYQGNKDKLISGHVVGVIIPGEQYTIQHPSGPKFSVWREDIKRKVERIRWAGISEQLYQEAIKKPRTILKKCDRIIESINTLGLIGTEDQRGHCARLVLAVTYAKTEILKHLIN